MKIGGINGANPQAGQMGKTQLSDSVSKNLQKQIANKQKQLQELSSNEELSMEEKRKKRQEIMQEINDLNNQLRQHQIELRREAANAQKMQKKDSSMEELMSKNKKDTIPNKGTGFSKAGMQTMISADSSLKQAQVQGSVVTAMKGRAGVLRGEIKQDSGRTDVKAKKEELAKVEQTVDNVTAAQINTLKDANKEIAKTKEAEQKTKKKENTKEVEQKTKKKENTKEVKTSKEQEMDKEEKAEKMEKKRTGSNSQTENANSKQPISIDIYL